MKMRFFAVIGATLALTACSKDEDTTATTGTDATDAADATDATDADGADATDADGADATDTDGADATDADGADATDADGSDMTDMTDGMDATDMTDGMDATDMTDGMDATDMTDGMDATDMTDGMDATDMTDGMDATDGMDGSDGTDGATTLYDTVGGQAAVEALIDTFIGKVAGDAKINAYFLNKSNNLTRLRLCLVKQVSSILGAPGITYPGAGQPADADGCRNMKDAHTDMGVSKADFGDLLGHIVSSATELGVPAEIISAAGSVFGAMEADIVEDTTNDATIYQRVGRKPAIAKVIDDFVGLVVADPEINGFFGTANVARLKTCLVRQVADVAGGPAIYGEEVEAEVVGADGSGNPCAEMGPSHAGMKDDQGNPITKADFDALVNHVAAAASSNGVSEADLGALAGVLVSLCPSIVADPASCTQ